MAKHHGWAVTAPLYPLAPESNAKATTEWSLDFYRHYVEGLAAKPFVMAGDSAGAGLTCATVQMARDAGLALPAALIPICPWLNLDPSHPDQPKIERRDGILTVSGIAEGGKLYAADLALDDPRGSPIFGNWDGLPPILCFGGGDDLIVTDARALKAKVSSVEYIEIAGLPHDWPIFTFTESREAQARMAEFAAQAVT
jgi:epsilon-lactone hydrolase